MTTRELVLILMVFLLTIAIVTFVFIIFRVGKMSFPNLAKILSRYDLTLKKHFYMAAFYDEVYDFLSEIEIRQQIRLSEEAKQLLILPIIEVQRINNRRRVETTYPNTEFENAMNYWRNSIIKIVEDMKNEPARIDKQGNDLGERSSISVIKAFANKFCNIPPFCGER